ncbi:hypothetical protein L593_09590 [Salinarchaeum sp. Harcht-Bsk1]|uniref:hypothetical protein n=1 Tax=Salinarchaeum sp. Harcht-Bsk1 TaxID=1333523 RepID=UPI0003423580|nr:hypothetical protein [Salinarchaeum sp. Harcht-Bsk1]AGN01863.1 hypothetical protein L593_09590 [Salinarchaeum sp. Harcht-Bsk1]
MLRRLLAAVAGIGLAAGVSFGLFQVVPLRYALAVGAGLGAGVFLVVDGSAGAGEGWVYHQVRPVEARIRDFLWAAGLGTALGLTLAWVTVVVELGRIGAGILVVVGSVLLANLVFLYRRPKYEEALEES